MDIPHKDIVVTNITEGEEVVAYLQPDWYLIKNIKFNGGITNKIFGYIDESCKNKNEMILLRIYGNNTDYIIDRKRELQTHIKLNKAGFASSVYCTLKNGYLYGFIDGITLTTESVRCPKVYPVIAKSIAKMHGDVECSGEPIFYPKLITWMRQVPDYFTEKLECLQSLTENENFCKAELLDELNAVNSKILSRNDLLVGFCHNDLLLENIIHNTIYHSISFIDYEYGDTNYLAFDIGNHFAEYAGVQSVDYNLYPREDYQKWWLEVYLEEFHKIKDLGPVTEEHISTLYKQVNFFSLCAHLFWGIWAIVQSLNSDIDFDYADYGRMRLQEYFKQKVNYFNNI